MKRRTYSDYLKAYKKSTLMSAKVIRGMEFEFFRNRIKSAVKAR